MSESKTSDESTTLSDTQDLPSSSSSSTSAVELVRLMLGKLVRVSVSDGRILEGEFLCLDREFNIVLGNAFEYNS